jgi:hypothetical protein
MKKIAIIGNGNILSVCKSFAEIERGIVIVEKKTIDTNLLNTDIPIKELLVKTIREKSKSKYHK